MNYKIIATGSTGNAVVINNYMLIDCGVSLRSLSKVKKDLKIVSQPEPENEPIDVSFDEL